MAVDQAPHPSSALLTFLFTDIEGSTRRWEVDPKAMRGALAVHDELLGRVVDEHGGHLFSHTGDGVCAAFSSPRAAVDAAVAAQRALELPVRMGIATGEAEATGRDYFGPVLNRAARVMAAGHGGQILLDGTTAGLLSGVDLKPMGRRRLRDITKPTELFQVRDSGLPTDFPPLRTLDPSVGNLTPQATSFLGREAELDQVHAVLSAHRLVTLTGVGGVGKTRLALEVASRTAPDFVDGVWVIELAPVGDPAAVPEAVAATLGITQQPGMTTAQSVAAALEGRSRLLVFDNCEHVLDAVANLVQAILDHSSTVAVLVTSREGLRLNGEQLWPVRPLDVRGGPDSAAARLFLDRAWAVSPEISLSDPHEADTVVEICRRLDGIPLALELAASRMLSMTATELLDRLDDRFRLLAGFRRGVERHQTLHNAVQWSYDMLDVSERVLLNRCSVFAGGFDLGAAAAVTGQQDEYATLELLDALTRKSLVMADKSARQTRYSMLETIRQFAYENLETAGEADQARTAHSRYFADCEAAVLTMWDSSRQREAYDWLTNELANLRTAFRWATDHSDLDTAATIAAYTAFLGGWIELHETSTWAEELVARARVVDHPRLAQLYVAASECYRTGRIDDALGYAEAGVTLIQSGRYDPIIHDIEPTALGGTYITKGMADRWLGLCRDRLTDEARAHPYNRGSLVMALLTAGKHEDAIAACDDVLKSIDHTDNPGAVAYALLAYGYACRTSRLRDAYEALRRGLDIAQASGNRMIESYLAVNLSTFGPDDSTPAETLDFLSLAINILYDSGTYSHMVSPLGVLAAHFDRIGRYEAAATLIGFAANAFALATFPEIRRTGTHLREVLGDQAFESCTALGGDMTNARAAQYALEQIADARADLLGVGGPP
ncbi:cyclase [Mycobacterium sp. ACS1612]|uniref:ATP-binding protein n=1 Tax=Mycobacterium sp. ACS1612 TaxID=1834117 RepID=UPI000801CB60|nr:adenylate/guanylate cyclase domain-containing protein [Mycobacterium sp. ACS1612]OBF28372.1 cyclase [Mycobacterium sp. ACS1612]